MTFSVSRPQWQLQTPAPELYFSSLQHMGLINVSGAQAVEFIHGQITADVNSLTDEQWRWGAHCDPKGKMLASFRLFKSAGDLMMLMPRSTITADLPQLQKYAVFSQAELVDVSDQYRLIGVAGSKATEWVNRQFGHISAELTQVDSGVIVKDGGDTPRYLLMLTKDVAEEMVAKHALSLLDASAWQALEIGAGYPNLTADHSGQFVPQMCNLQSLHGISFNKGCYMGQETVARMKYRGGNKRALYVISGTTTSAVGVHSKLEIAVEDGYRRAGNIIEWVQWGEQVLLSAVLANDTEIGAELRLSDDSNSQLTVQPLPYPIEPAE